MYFLFYYMEFLWLFVWAFIFCPYWSRNRKSVFICTRSVVPSVNPQWLRVTEHVCIGKFMTAVDISNDRTIEINWCFHPDALSIATCGGPAFNSVSVSPNEYIDFRCEAADSINYHKKTPPAPIVLYVTKAAECARQSYASTRYLKSKAYRTLC